MSCSKDNVEGQNEERNFEAGKDELMNFQYTNFSVVNDGENKFAKPPLVRVDESMFLVSPDSSALSSSSSQLTSEDEVNAEVSTINLRAAELAAKRVDQFMRENRKSELRHQNRETVKAGIK